ncbi:MAG TPA: prolyl oligopeptidase family serine peptidase [Ornithinibacter sp.]|nr:prolyl oligopeptidase family serine peptidase [Ornithinibacter sp.]
MTTMPTTTPPEAPHRSSEPGAAHGRHHWWRWVAGVLAVLLVLFTAVAWYFSGRIASGALASNPASFPPAYDDVGIVAVDDTSVTLSKGPDAADNFGAPGSYGLAWDGGTGQVGPATANPDGTVTRSFELVTGQAPTAGATAAVERAYWLGDPAVTMGLTTREVQVDGTFPAWYFPADEPSTTTAIVVHGQNGSRMDGLREVDVLHDLGMPVLVITYRNDVGAPKDPSGRLQYGATEWQDLDAAVTWATGNGADHVVLVGQSMGGAVVASFLEKSPQAGVVSRVVLDAPMLSLDEAVTYGARDELPGGRAVPAPVIWAAEQLTSLRYGVDWSAVDYLDDTSWVQVPTLVLHGTADPTVPVTVSQELAAAEPELVTLETFPDALHVESWNFDRARYTDLVGSFLDTTG